MPTITLITSAIFVFPCSGHVGVMRNVHRPLRTFVGPVPVPLRHRSEWKLPSETHDPSCRVTPPVTATPRIFSHSTSGSISYGLSLILSCSTCAFILSMYAALHSSGRGSDAYAEACAHQQVIGSTQTRRRPQFLNLSRLVLFHSLVQD